jgi:CubicO group peptidase (beta-lactamase class C family)
LNPSTRFFIVLALIVLFVISCDIFASEEDAASRIEKLMTKYEQDDRFSGAVLAAEGDSLVFEGAFGLANREWKILNTLDTRFRIASISKPFTKILVLQQVENGNLKLDDVIADHIPEYSGPGADVITVEQLLTHRSGIVGERAVRDLDDIERHYYTKERLLDHIAGYDLWFEPGSRWGYSNFGYSVLAVILERASGHSYAELLETRICEPAGMKDTVVDVTSEIMDRRAAGYHFIPNKGIVNATLLEMSFTFGAGQLMSTVRDLYRWNRALMDGVFLNEEHTEFILNAACEQDPVGKLRRKIDVVRFGGSINGFLCSTHSYTQDDRFIVVLSNLKDVSGKMLPSTFDVAREIAAAMYGYW